MLIKQILVVGLGLMGGSVAKAIKRFDPSIRILGMDSISNLDTSQVIDRVVDDWGEALAQTDLVVLSVPVGQMKSLFEAMLPHLNERTILTDVGSTKVSLIDEACCILGDRMRQFVPSHPLAGAEKHGFLAAKESLFDHQLILLTPLDENKPDAVKLVQQFWYDCGAGRVTSLSAKRHDELLAMVSHLPHLLSYALVYECANREDSKWLFDLAAGGFRDFTRIAESSPTMWRDVCLHNQSAIIKELDAYVSQLLAVRQKLVSLDGKGLEVIFERASDCRRQWYERRYEQTNKDQSDNSVESILEKEHDESYPTE